MPDWHELQSSNLAACAYDDASSTLHVRFRSGRSYALQGVAKSTYEALCEASSPGAYYNSELKGRYPGG